MHEDHRARRRLHDADRPRADPVHRTSSCARRVRRDVLDPRRGHDDQRAHEEDEIYVVTAGAATIWADTGSARVSAGDVIYVPAGEIHHFVDISADLSLIVVFAPPHRPDPVHPREADRAA
ncbi:cupin domain-containing protein [Luedemannella flava]